MTIEQLNKEFHDLSTNLEKIDELLLSIAKPIIEKIKAKAPSDTGKLKASIKAEIENNTLIIKMLNYGAFQNYGVKGKNDSKGKEVEFGINLQPKSSVFAFEKRKFGITQRNFFDVNEITDEIIEKITENII